MTLLVEIDLTAGGAALLWPCTLPFNQSAIYKQHDQLPFAPLMAGFGGGAFPGKRLVKSSVPSNRICCICFRFHGVSWNGGTVGNTHLDIIDATTMIMKIARIYSI